MHFSSSFGRFINRRIKGNQKDYKVWFIGAKFKCQIKKETSKITSRAKNDKNKDFILTTDVSDYVMNAIMSQVDENDKETIISCFSKKIIRA